MSAAPKYPGSEHSELCAWRFGAKTKCDCGAHPDLEVQNEGTIFLLRPCTDTGAAWIGENFASEEAMYFGDALCVEHRFIEDIVQGAISDGLEVR